MNPEHSESKALKVFLVEDSEIMVRLITGKVETIETIQIDGLSDKVDGTFNQIVSKQPDVVVLDLKLKDGNGIELLSEIRKAFLPVKVIVFTMYNSFEKECRKNGCDYFFDKSNNFDELIHTLRVLSYLNGKKNEIII